MKTLINKSNPQIRITAPDFEDNDGYYSFSYGNRGVSLSKQRWTLVEEEETTKIADSILPNCTANAKSQNRWHKVSDSLPDTPREVLCKDAIGNYFVGRYYGTEPWVISVYDDTDKTNEYNPPVVEWADILVEKEPTEGIKGNLEEIPSNVDLEKEYTEFVVSDPVYSKLVNGIVGKSIARHFYELGRKVRKEE